MAVSGPDGGDAVAEAGLAPNSLQTAYSDEHLLTLLLALVVESGKFPTHAELRMKAHTTPNFPSHTTFGRLGGKGKQAAALLKYCKESEGPSSVVTICEAIVANMNAGDVTDSKVNALVPEIGEVYLIKSGKFFKIGRSNSSGRRQYELAIQLPQQARLIHSMKTDDPIGIEGYWHKRFSDKRKNGEWFALSTEDIQAFRRRTFM